MSPLTVPAGTPGFEPPRVTLTAGQALGLLFKALREWQAHPEEYRTVGNLQKAIDRALNMTWREPQAKH